MVYYIENSSKPTGKPLELIIGTSLVVQWLGLHTSNAGGVGLIPGHGTKIQHAVWCGQKKNDKIELIRVHQGYDIQDQHIIINRIQGYDQDGGVREHGAHLPPMNTSIIHLHAEQLSLKTNWKLAEGLLYKQHCKKDTHVIR